MMRSMLIVGGCVLVLLGIGAATLGLNFWSTALAVAPDRAQGHPIWLSAEIYIFFSVAFLALGLLSFGLAELLYRLPR